jgi:ubiquinone/menaquinone biosynthesis C-methylase UbiE
MALDKAELMELYRRRAECYDLTANLYYLIGFREFAYRKKAIQALALKPGDTVVEIGCGTGLNFRLLREAVAPEGRVIGLDLTLEMLKKASKRLEVNNWSNIELVQSDVALYQFPEKVDGILSTFAITLIPEYDRIIGNGATALGRGERFVIMDFKLPHNWPMWLIKLFVFISKPFGVSLDLADRHPWESINRYLTMVQFQEIYFGLVYLCAGEARAPRQVN